MSAGLNRCECEMLLFARAQLFGSAQTERGAN